MSGRIIWDTKGLPPIYVICMSLKFGLCRQFYLNHNCWEPCVSVSVIYRIKRRSTQTTVKLHNHNYLERVKNASSSILRFYPPNSKVNFSLSTAIFLCNSKSCANSATRKWTGYHFLSTWDRCKVEKIRKKINFIVVHTWQPFSRKTK